MTVEACVPSEIKPKRKSPRRALEFRARIKELALAGKTPIQTAKITGRTKQAVFLHLKNLVADRELRPDQTNYVKAGPIEERKWYKVAEANVKELPFYTKQGLVPSVRKMYYRHVELGNLEKCKSDYDRLCRVAAEQRKGIDSTYTKSTIYPRLSIDCFRDEKRIVLGNTNIDNSPSDPTPDEAPQDWEEYIEEEITAVKNHFRRLKNAPDNYDGECSPGDKGVNPGRCYNQPTYREIWCESATIQPDLDKWFGEDVYVAASGGFISTDYFSKNCKRLARIAATHDNIEKIVILYLRDFDKAGGDIAENLRKGFEYYCGILDIHPDDPDFIIDVEVEFIIIAITPDQIQKYNLIEDPEQKSKVQLEAFLTTEEKIEIFKQIIQDELDDCWDEDVYIENCPDEEYDYEANGEEEPEDVDIDDYPEDPQDGEEDLTIREIMEKRIAEAFKPGWENE
ncbi:MAG: hypothetical protein M3P08_14235 [Thermoproteota archaeon]|nr:hypothetical protein [Thermoproteota archaeon]